MNIRKKGIIILLIMVLFIFMGSASAASTTKKVSVNDKKFTNVTIPFTQNNGQIADKNVKYSANTLIGSVYVENNGIVYRLSKDKKSWIVSEHFNGANHVAVTGLNKSKTKVNYYIGSSKNWKTNVSTYQQVLYTNLYTGVNLHLKAHGKNIEKIYVISRNGSPNSIWVSVDGSTGLKINKNGELEILNGSSALKLTKPAAYQIINGKRVNVSVSYILNGTSYGYKTGAYNKNYKLIIDPLLASTYLGGSSYDSANDITVGKDGSVYVTGYTGSTDFPTVNADQPAIKSGEWDVFVSRFSSDLSTLIESTYLGGSLSDQAKSIALDNNGNVFITGITYSTGTGTLNDFPTGINGLKMSWETGAGDVFVSKLTSDLGFVRSAIIGGNREDVANGILVDASNNIYITGQTFSFNGTDPKNVPVTSYPVMYSGFGEPTMATTYTGIGDVFVTKLNNDLTDMTEGVVFGGVDGSTSYASAIAIDQQNNIYITGATNSSTFPVIQLANKYPDNGLLNNKGNYDAFVVKLAGQALENIDAVALLGGSEKDVGNNIAVDQVGRVYVVGGTWSTDFKPNPTQTSTNNGKEDGFVTIMDKQLQNTLFSIYLGGNGVDVANDIVLSFLGSKFGVIGTTNSTSKFPGTTENNGNEDVFFTSFNYTNYPQFVSSSILGGANADYGLAGAIDNYGNTYIAGNTWSNDYPTTIGAYQTSKNEDQYVEDAYVSQVDDLADYEPPVVTKTDPANNAKEVPINKVIKIVYNEPITSSDLSGITLSSNGGNVLISYKISGNTLVITPLSKYQMGTTYTLDIPEGTIEDLAGNVADEYTTSFTTLTPLKVTTTTPTSGSVVATNTVIKITFNKPIKAGTKYSTITLKNSSNTKIAITKSISGNVLTITKASGTFAGDTYTLTIPVNSLLDLNNTAMASDYTMNFIVDAVPTTITKTDPVNGATKVATNKTITITFSKPINSVNMSLVTVKSSNGTVITVTPVISKDGKTLTLNLPTGKLYAKATKYTVTFQSNSILDRNNNYMLPYSFSFTTTS